MAAVCISWWTRPAGGAELANRTRRARSFPAMDLGDLSTVLDRNHHQQPALFCCVAVLRSCNSAQIVNFGPLDSYSCSCGRKRISADAPCRGRIAIRSDCPPISLMAEILTFLTCRESDKLDQANEWGWHMDAISSLNIADRCAHGHRLDSPRAENRSVSAHRRGVALLGGVVGNIVSMVKDLGSNGLVGLITVGIIMWLFSKRSLA